MTTTKKGKTVNTSKLQPGELFHMDFAFYNVNSIRGFTSMLTLVCSKTRMLWVYPTAPKIASVRIIRFILTTIMNKQHPCKRVRFDEASALEKSTYAKNLLVDEFKIYMETNGGDASWLNGKNERHNRGIHNMARSGILDSNQQGKKWCRAAEKSAEVHRCIIHNDLENISPHFE